MKQLTIDTKLTNRKKTKPAHFANFYNYLICVIIEKIIIYTHAVIIFHHISTKELIANMTVNWEEIGEGETRGR